MRYGASLDLRMDDSVAEFAEFLAGLGLSHVELRQSYLDTRSPPPTTEELAEVRESYDLTYTVHAPYTDANPGNLNESLRRAMAESLVETLDTAAAIGASGVVTHGGSVSAAYPDRVQTYAREQAVRTVRIAARHAEDVGVPLCVENQRTKPRTRYNTSTPTDLAAFLDAVDVESPPLSVTLDVGHAKASGVDHGDFVEAFGDRIVVAHLHDNDGASDAHDPLPGYESVAGAIGAPYNVLEMKSREDVVRCVRE
ncbi:sugar phosphate isomerase/epimerase family protein [Halomarina litorea]|uniref:sugar phosphate isomerase/epimerase family protein n=1 Tax=Halomarina litorea TaxID=2961595 RepID=UPI0020C3521A|nr:sugar phosphate isomerase/epimerase family protein [Halomarina sp. BCD28]